MRFVTLLVLSVLMVACESPQIVRHQLNTSPTTPEPPPICPPLPPPVAPEFFNAQWATTALHGSLGRLPIPINADGSTVEPRQQADGVQIQFESEIDPTSFNPADIQILMVDLFNTVTDVSSAISQVTIASDNFSLEIIFTTAFVNQSFYRLRLPNISSLDGRDLSIETKTMSFWMLRGDVDGNHFVNAGDRGHVSANLGISPVANLLARRADQVTDGFVNAGDRGAVSANIGLSVDGILSIL